MSRLDDVAQRLEQEAREIAGRLAVKQRIQQELDKLSVELLSTQQALADIEQSASIIGAVEASQQQDLRAKIEKLVSSALSKIFEQPYQFVLKQTARGSQVNTQFCITTPQTGDALIPLRDAHGGGLVVVCAFLLRLIILLSTRPLLAPILFDDEPFVAVSSDHRERLVTFLRYLADKSGVKFVMITHESALASVGDKAYKFKLSGGLTKSELIDGREAADL